MEAFCLFGIKKTATKLLTNLEKSNLPDSKSLAGKLIAMWSFKLLTYLMLITSFTISKAQGFEWKEDRPLSWADFRGKPNYNSGAASILNSAIYYSYKRVEKDSSYNFTFNVQNVMETMRSWVKRKSMSDYLLGHEQLHFDINEIYARKLVAAFRNTVYTSNFDKEIDTIYSKVLGELNDMQIRYDQETQHGNDVNKQYRWKLLIYLELRKLPRNY